MVMFYPLKTLRNAAFLSVLHMFFSGSLVFSEEASVENQENHEETSLNEEYSSETSLADYEVEALVGENIHLRYLYDISLFGETHVDACLALSKFRKSKEVSFSVDQSIALNSLFHFGYASELNYERGEEYRKIDCENIMLGIWRHFEQVRIPSITLIMKRYLNLLNDFENLTVDRKRELLRLKNDISSETSMDSASGEIQDLEEVFENLRKIYVQAQDNLRDFREEKKAINWSKYDNKRSLLRKPLKNEYQFQLREFNKWVHKKYKSKIGAPFLPDDEKFHLETPSSFYFRKILSEDEDLDHVYKELRELLPRERKEYFNDEVGWVTTGDSDESVMKKAKKALKASNSSPEAYMRFAPEKPKAEDMAPFIRQCIAMHYSIQENKLLEYFQNESEAGAKYLDLLNGKNSFSSDEIAEEGVLGAIEKRASFVEKAKKESKLFGVALYKKLQERCQKDATKEFLEYVQERHSEEYQAPLSPEEQNKLEKQLDEQAVEGEFLFSLRKYLEHRTELLKQNILSSNKHAVESDQDKAFYLLYDAYLDGVHSEIDTGMCREIESGNVSSTEKSQVMDASFFLGSRLDEASSGLSQLVNDAISGNLYAQKKRYSVELSKSSGVREASLNHFNDLLSVLNPNLYRDSPLDRFHEDRNLDFFTMLSSQLPVSENSDESSGKQFEGDEIIDSSTLPDSELSYTVKKIQPVKGPRKTALFHRAQFHKDFFKQGSPISNFVEDNPEVIKNRVQLNNSLKSYDYYYDSHGALYENNFNANVLAAGKKSLLKTVHSDPNSTEVFLDYLDQRFREKVLEQMKSLRSDQTQLTESFVEEELQIELKFSERGLPQKDSQMREVILQKENTELSQLKAHFVAEDDTYFFKLVHPEAFSEEEILNFFQASQGVQTEEVESHGEKLKSFLKRNHLYEGLSENSEKIYYQSALNGVRYDSLPLEYRNYEKGTVQDEVEQRGAEVMNLQLRNRPETPFQFVSVDGVVDKVFFKDIELNGSFDTGFRFGLRKHFDGVTATNFKKAASNFQGLLQPGQEAHLKSYVRFFGFERSQELFSAFDQVLEVVESDEEAYRLRPKTAQELIEFGKEFEEKSFLETPGFQKAIQLGDKILIPNLLVDDFYGMMNEYVQADSKDYGVSQADTMRNELELDEVEYHQGQLSERAQLSVKNSGTHGNGIDLSRRPKLLDVGLYNHVVGLVVQSNLEAIAQVKEKAKSYFPQIKSESFWNALNPVGKKMRRDNPRVAKQWFLEFFEDDVQGAPLAEEDFSEHGAKMKELYTEFRKAQLTMRENNHILKQQLGFDADQTMNIHEMLEHLKKLEMQALGDNKSGELLAYKWLMDQGITIAVSGGVASLVGLILKQVVTGSMTAVHGQRVTEKLLKANSKRLKNGNISSADLDELYQSFKNLDKLEGVSERLHKNGLSGRAGLSSGIHIVKISQAMGWGQNTSSNWFKSVKEKQRYLEQVVHQAALPSGNAAILGAFAPLLGFSEGIISQYFTKKFQFANAAVAGASTKVRSKRPRLFDKVYSPAIQTAMKGIPKKDLMAQMVGGCISGATFEGMTIELLIGAKSKKSMINEALEKRNKTYSELCENLEKLAEANTFSEEEQKNKRQVNYNDYERGALFSEIAFLRKKFQSASAHYAVLSDENVPFEDKVVEVVHNALTNCVMEASGELLGPLMKPSKLPGAALRMAKKYSPEQIKARTMDGAKRFFPGQKVELENGIVKVDGKTISEKELVEIFWRKRVSADSVFKEKASDEFKVSGSKLKKETFNVAAHGRGLAYEKYHEANEDFSLLMTSVGR